MTVRLLVVLLTCLVSAPIVAADDSLAFLTHRDGKLYDRDQEFRFVSWNIPNLHVVEDAFEFLGDTPWRWPDEYEVTDALESVRQMGGQVCRTYVISVARDAGDMGEHVHVIKPGVFNEEAFASLDLVLKVARDKGVRVILPLVDNWHWWGGVRQYEGFRNAPEGSFWTDKQVRKDFKRTVRYVLNRRNTLTGVRYRDDPTIFGWETGNELDATPEWTADIAAYLKRLDPNHLVIDGRSLHGVPVESLDDPNIDVVTTHHYPNVGNNNAESVEEALRIIAGKKAYFVGEFGFLPVDEAARMIDAVADGGASGALYWSLRFHRREGGFYWHHEASGQNVFKSYHWPSFKEGEPYREHLVVPLLREKAAKIRGLDSLVLPTPQPPKMLPPETPGLLSWQGSTGASGYHVYRSESPHGPWSRIAKNVSDAATQYRPLWADEAAPIGKEAYYCVTAVNESGSSAPSDPIGPYLASSRLLVDELGSLDRLSDHSGGVSLLTGDERRVQEDIHRAGMPPDSQVTYTVGGPLRSARVWLFCKNAQPSVRVLTSTDGEAFAQAEVSMSSVSSRDSDYGYLTPVLLEASRLPGGATSIRLETDAGADADLQVSRVELRYTPRP